MDADAAGTAAAMDADAAATSVAIEADAAGIAAAMEVDAAGIAAAMEADAAGIAAAMDADAAAMDADLAEAAGALTIDDLGAAGDGIARDATGATLFLPRTLPGERVAPGPARGGRAEPLRVWRASADRVSPPCPHFGLCGGCALQHWAAAPQAAWKRARLVAALARAGFSDAAVAPTVTVAPGTRRRADLAVRRTPGGVVVGFHAAGSATVVAIDLCHVLDPRLVALLAPLRGLLERLPALGRQGSAVLSRLDTGPDLLLRTDRALDAAGRTRLAAFAAAHGLPRIAWARGEDAPEVAAQLGPALLRVPGGARGVEVAVPPGAFLQAVPAGEAAIRAAVLAGLPDALAPRATLIELYAGLGTLTVALAGRGRVTAYEGDAAAVAALGAAAARAGLTLRAVRRDLVRQPLSVAELRCAAAVVLDPPFAGAGVVMPAIAAARVPRVVYVSCNPAALGRDAAVLHAAGYRVVAATPIDQFLWSAQLEAVVTFSLQPAAARVQSAARGMRDDAG